MVAVLLRLRFRVLANTLQRNPMQLVAVVTGGVLALGLVMLVLAGMLLASTAPPPVTQALVVIGGTALVFGWLAVPLLFEGVDRTLEPLKLAPFPLGTGTLMAAMFVSGVAWLPGIATVAVSLATAIAWHAYPVSAFAAIVLGLLGAATCVVGSRVTTAAAGALLRGRGAARAVSAALGVMLLAIPLAIAALDGVAVAGGGDPLAGFTAAVQVLSWSPFGAVWSVPGRIAMGDAPGAAVAATIAVGTFAAAAVLWRLTLSAGLRVRGERAPHPAAGGHLGLFGRVPSTPTAAVLARSLIYWFRDARQARQLLLLPLLPALLLIWWRLFDLDGFALVIGPIVASLLPMSAFAALSYDGTAFAAELAAGVRGVHDRLGRALAMLIIAAPATTVVQVAVAVLIGRVEDLPALLGLSLGVLLISLGVVSVSSARIVVPVARPGRNPFSAQPGAVTTSIFASYAVAAVTIALTLPVAALAIAALLTGFALLGWIALIAGLASGATVALGGVVLGGRLLDASGPELLARLRLLRV
ncbi:transporter [Microbacterium deminutum]|uniref:Transporter n=1 Tax=Microbacterium deminutum TaxID=344164 RepID=A0ABP5BVP6_9MICO